MKRFYREVTTAAADGGHLVRLDGRPLRTPAKQPLVAPSARLAAAIAAEWQDQGETIQPATMPLTRLASTALDRMPAQRQAAIDEVVAYADTDLLCYRAAAPLDLVRRQHEAWQPMLAWLESAHRVRLRVTTTMVPVTQPEAARERLRALVEILNDWPLVGLHAATTALGSLVLALALRHRRIDARAALATSLLDERFEIERWGSDPEIERRHAALRRDVEAAARFLADAG